MYVGGHAYVTKMYVAPPTLLGAKQEVIMDTSIVHFGQTRTESLKLNMFSHASTPPHAGMFRLSGDCHRL